MRRVLRVELSDAPANEREHGRHVTPALDGEECGDFERAGARRDGLHAGEGVAAERLELVVGARGEALEAVVDDRDAQLERLQVGEELLALSDGVCSSTYVG